MDLEKLLNPQDGTGVDSELSDDAFEQDPVLAKYQTDTEQHYWFDELEASRKERKEFDERGRKTIMRFADERTDADQGRSNLNLFYQNTLIKMAALYARTPVPDIKRRFDDPDDDVSRVAATLLQRNIAYELECTNFDAKIKAMLFDRLVPGVGFGWLRFDQTEGDYEYEHQPDPLTGQAVPQPIPGSHIKDQQAETDYVAWDDFLWSPCRTWTECRWVARRVPMSKAAVKARFANSASEDVINSLSFAVQKAAKVESKDTLKPKNLTEATLDVMEVWDKERKLVFWVTEQAEVPLDVQQDANEFEGFFPTPLPPLGNFTTSNTLPLSDFRALQSQYRELDDLNNRGVQYLKAMQVRWLYDAKHVGIKDLYQTGSDLQGIPIKDWAVMAAEGGGMRNSMEFAPLDQIVGAYDKVTQAIDKLKQRIYEIEGISDFQRGIQQPYVTAGAAQATATAGAGRLQMAQGEVADYIQRMLRLKAHLICKFYEPKTILARAGVLPQPDQQYIGPALQLLRDEQLRHFRLTVSIESIQSPIWNQEAGDRTQVLTAIGTFMAQAMPIAQQAPSLIPMMLEALKMTVAGMRGAKGMEGILDQGIQQFLQAQSAQQSTPPKPSPEQLKSQAAQATIQAGLQKTQMQEATKQQLGQMQAQLEAARIENDRLNTQLKAAQLQHSIDHDNAQQHIDRLDSVHSTAHDLASLVPGLGG